MTQPSYKIPARKLFHGYSYIKNEPLRMTGKEWMALADKLNSPVVKLHGLAEVKFKHHEVYLDGTNVYGARA
jgi:hypothetical protein